MHDIWIWSQTNYQIIFCVWPLTDYKVHSIFLMIIYKKQGYQISCDTGNVHSSYEALIPTDIFVLYYLHVTITKHYCSS